MFEGNETYSCLTDDETRVKRLDNAIESLQQDIAIANKVIQHTEKGWALVEAKLHKERLVALTALTKSKLLLAEIKVFLAENELNNLSGNGQGSKNLNPKASEDDTHSKTSPAECSKKRQKVCISSSSSSTPKRRSNTSCGKENISKSKSVSRSSSAKTKTSHISKQRNIVPEKSARNNPSTSNIRRTSKSSNFTQESVDHDRIPSPKPNTASPHSDLVSNLNINSGFKHETFNTTPQSPDIKTLTDSIIAEFDKSISSDCTLTTESPAKKIRINPVPNVADYINAEHRLLATSHVSNSTPTKIEPPLHPGDPGTYPNSHTKENYITETPMRLSVPYIKSEINEITDECPPHTNTLFESASALLTSPQDENNESMLLHNVSVPECLKSEKMPFLTSCLEQNQTSTYVPSIQRLIQPILDPLSELEIVNNFTYINSPKISEYTSRDLRPLAVKNRHVCVPSLPMYKTPVPKHRLECNPRNELQN